jgi:gas vesicle protein
MGKFKKGLCLGGFLGAGLMWLNATTKGKKVREQMLDHSADIFVDMKKKAMISKEWKNMTKSKYIKLVQSYVDKYAKKNGLANNVQKLVKKVLIAQWSNIKKDMK